MGTQIYKLNNSLIAIIADIHMHIIDIKNNKNVTIDIAKETNIICSPRNRWIRLTSSYKPVSKLLAYYPEYVRIV